MEPVVQSTSIEIAAPPDRAWAVMIAVERWPEFIETVTGVKRLDEGPLALGSRVRLRQPRVPETEYRVTELTPERSFTWVATGPGVRTTARHELTPTADGCRLTLTVEQAGWLGARMARLFLRSMTDRYLALEAGAVKQRSEASDSTS